MAETTSSGLRSRSRLVAGAPVRPDRTFRVLECLEQPPLGLRTAANALWLVSTAASPVGRDQVELDLALAEEGTVLEVRSNAATVAWSGQASQTHVRAQVADACGLRWQVEPLVLTGGCHHSQLCEVQLQGQAWLWWEEITVLGRLGEQPGDATCSLRVTLDGLPLVHHQLAVGPSHPGWSSGAGLGRARVAASLVLAGRGADLPEPSVGEGWAVFELEGPARLVTALGSSMQDARRRLRAALAGLPGWAMAPAGFLCASRSM